MSILNRSHSKKKTTLHSFVSTLHVVLGPLMIATCELMGSYISDENKMTAVNFGG